MRKRLFWQIFGGFVLVLIVFTTVVGLIAWANYNPSETANTARPLAAYAVETLNLGEDATEKQRAAGFAQARELGSDVAVYRADGSLIGTSNPALPTPADHDFEAGFFHIEGRQGYLVNLDDGRWVAAARTTGGKAFGRFLGAMSIFLLVAMVGAAFLARRITRRLEALEERVGAWGDGDLTARAPALGRDEVGRLAERFNAAADRVAELVSAHKSVVAHASHELRTPLARLRLAMEMMAEAEGVAERQTLLAGAERDIADLDDLIEVLLLRSKLEAKGYETPNEPVALRELARDEMTRMGLQVDGVAGEETVVHGDRRMLARALENLLQNAQKYGGDDVRVVLEPDAGARRVRLVVEDDGPGVPEGERERIFEPFYQHAGTTKDGHTRGVGLGLSLVRDIARHHGGEAHYEPRDTGGSRFVVAIPLAS